MAYQRIILAGVSLLACGASGFADTIQLPGKGLPGPIDPRTFHEVAAGISSLYLGPVIDLTGPAYAGRSQESLLLEFSAAARPASAVQDAQVAARLPAEFGAAADGSRQFAQEADAVNLSGSAPLIARAALPTALEGHIAFFDRNHDGIITLSETAAGLQELGLGRLRAWSAATIIHAFLGPKTSGGFTTDITVSNIHLGKHPSDTGVYDAKGNFVPQAFEAMFKFDKNNSGSLNELEIAVMIDANDKKNPGAKAASMAEFDLLLEIAADTKDIVDGKEVRAITKAALRRFFTDPLFFHDIALSKK